MKFVREVTEEGIKIPGIATKISKIEKDKTADLRVSEGVMVLLKRRMTAMELIKASQYLYEVASELVCHLALACGPCEECGDCCPRDDLILAEISIPGYLRKEAGISDGAKLSACVDEENSSIIITAAEHEHDLSDVPQLVIDMLVSSGICLGALEEHLITGSIVYDCD